MEQIVVSELNCYPVKSCRGISLRRAEVGPMGLRHDRQWMVVTDDGRFVAQRGDRSGVGVRVLHAVEAQLRDGALLLDAPRMPTLRLPLGGVDGEPREVRIWQGRCRAIDQGDDAAAWLGELLSRERPGGYRLVRMPDDEVRRSNRGDGRLAFADGYPFMLISRASLADLNRRIGRELEMDRFRPVIVIDGAAEPYLEDRIARLRIGPIELTGTTLCARCPIPTFDQRTGARSREPLRTLARYRRTERGVVFGRNFNHAGAGWIAVGDPVQVLEWHTEPIEPMWGSAAR